MSAFFRAEEFNLRFAKRTHIGKVRKLNEDFGLIREQEPWLMVVADGMGGHNAGEIASCMAAEEVLRTVEEGGMGGPAEISRAVERANSMVYEHSRSDSGCSGMGTTLVLALGGEGEAIVANVGDSRAYHFSYASGRLRQVTRDHSLVQELISAGRLTKEEAQNYPFRNVIMRAVGTSPAVTADLFEVELEQGDALLLCTDGMTNHVSDEQIQDVLSGMDDPDCACDALVDLALTGGGRDNITVAIACRPRAGGDGR